MLVKAVTRGRGVVLDKMDAPASLLQRGYRIRGSGPKREVMHFGTGSLNRF